jgi:CopG family nickel-responsive transcriptional regulator
MQRVTVTLDDALMADLDLLMAARGYQSRSEALRDLARAGIGQALLDTGGAQHCVAALVYVFDHSVRDLARRLTVLFHEHHDIAMVTTHIHLSHDSAMEVVLLKGPTEDVRALAETVQAERGVRHGSLIIVPAEIGQDSHRHGPSDTLHGHIRTR